MPLAPLFRVDLRRLIMLLAILSGVIALGISFYASYQVQRQSLIDNTLEANRAYAAKLADSTERFFQAAQQQLAYSATVISRDVDDKQAVLDEAVRLDLQTDSFNAVVITSAQGIVLATSPDTGRLVGKRLDSPGARQALQEQRPLISSPYMSAIETLVVLVSHPLFSSEGTYLGYVGGVISLKEKSILNSLLGEHYYQDGSYLYAVDPFRRLLYHPDPKRVGTVVVENRVIDAVTAGERGSQRVINSKGVDMLAGYAPVPVAGWGIVAQRPTAAPLTRSMG